jgi:butyrate kinase
LRINRVHKILVINIGSTSTKVGLFIESNPVFRESLRHLPEDTAKLHGYDGWLEFHHKAVKSMLRKHENILQGLDLVVSRGGLTKPIEGGAYRINEVMLNDLRVGAYGWHSCNIGPAIAASLADSYGVKAIIDDSPVADEMDKLSRFSGLSRIERQSALHVLSQKSAARRAAQELNMHYEQGNIVVAHLGGGITVGAHHKGRIIDATHGLSEGPFTPQRAGGLPIQEIVNLCFSGQYTREELGRSLFERGGVYSYLGTHDIEAVEARITQGDKEALLILRAMGYQVSKEIFAMAAVLYGRVDAVVLTGDLCRARTVVTEISDRVRLLAPLKIFPGEDELESLAAGGYRIMRPDGEKLKEYSSQTIQMSK